jgi:hypothetical protein
LLEPFASFGFTRCESRHAHVFRPARRPGRGVPADLARKPGDEAPPGAPGTGENVCRRCDGSGKVDGATCPECKGTGVLTVVIGGA